MVQLGTIPTGVSFLDWLDGYRPKTEERTAIYEFQSLHNESTREPY
jgi:hypothetical protein